jgi:hypothetical protein
MKFLSSAICSVLLASCAGYRLGPVKPEPLAAVRTIAVPMMANDTLHPRAEVLATSAIASALTADGTYRLASVGSADAVLEGRVRAIRNTSIRSRRYNTLSPAELNTTIYIEWQLKDASGGGRVLATGTALGTSQLFVDDDLQTARNNAIPDAVERAGVMLVSQLANGF